MYGVDLYGRVRLAVLGQGLSQREAARRFGIDRGTVRKMLAHSVPPGYRRGKSGSARSWRRILVLSIRSWPMIWMRQRSSVTIQRIYDRLREERGFDGG